MNLEETAHILGSMQQAGAKVNTAPATVQIWQRALAKYPKDLVSDIVQDYMAKEERDPRPSTIRQRCENVWERKLREESRMLLKNDPTKMTIAEFRELYPGRLLKQFEAGRREWCEEHGVPYVPVQPPPAWTFSDSSAIKNLNTNI